LVGLALPLLLIFENKPYNIFPIWMIGSMAIGYVLPSFTSSYVKQAASRITPSNPALGGIALLVIATGLIIVTIRTTYTVADGRLLSNWSFDAKQATPARDAAWQEDLLEARPEAFDPGAYKPSKALTKFHINRSHGDGERIQRYAGDAVTRLQFPAPASSEDSLSLSTFAFTSGSRRRRVEFFVYSPKTKRYRRGEFTMDILIDGENAQSIGIPLAGKNFQRFVVGPALLDNSCHTIAFRLRAADLSTSSGDRGPFVEIWMPRLID
jgi:hypothetical protein